MGEERALRSLMSLEASRTGRSTSASVAMACAAGRAAGLLPQPTNFEAFTRVKTSIRPAIDRDKNLVVTDHVAATPSLRTECYPSVVDGATPATVGGGLVSRTPTNTCAQHEVAHVQSNGKQREDSRDSVVRVSRRVPHSISTSSVDAESSRLTGGADNLHSQFRPDALGVRLNCSGEGRFDRLSGMACAVEPWEFLGNDVGLKDDNLGGNGEGLSLPSAKGVSAEQDLDVRAYCEDFNFPTFLGQEPPELFERSTLSSLSNPEAATHDQSCGYLEATEQLTKSTSVDRRKRCADGGQDPEDQDEQGEKNPWSRRALKKGRAAEVHNQSERRRRDRINEKMKALQELIPNSNKTDKASMLDDAVEYVKMLQWQLQVMSMRIGMSNPFGIPKVPGIPPAPLMSEARLLQVPYGMDGGMHMMGTIPGAMPAQGVVPGSVPMVSMLPPHQEVLPPGWSNYHMEPPHQ